jgi:hypothetical protein
MQSISSHWPGAPVHVRLSVCQWRGKLVNGRIPDRPSLARPPPARPPEHTPLSDALRRNVPQIRERSPPDGENSFQCSASERHLARSAARSAMTSACRFRRSSALQSSPSAPLQRPQRRFVYSTRALSLQGLRERAPPPPFVGIVSADPTTLAVFTLRRPLPVPANPIVALRSAKVRPRSHHLLPNRTSPPNHVHSRPAARISLQLACKKRPEHSEQQKRFVIALSVALVTQGFPIVEERRTLFTFDHAHSN